MRLSLIEDILDEQLGLLKSMLEKLKPVYSWYFKKGLVITHPTIKIRSPLGPILGYDQKENEVIVFNILSRRIYIYTTTKCESFTVYTSLLETGFLVML
jgi:hypothetical protein